MMPVLKTWAALEACHAKKVSQLEENKKTEPLYDTWI